MTCGIYALYWYQTDKIYIGQSINIEGRFTTHRSLFKYGHSNYKLKNHYNQYGPPSYEILELANPSELNTLEIYYIDEFDSIHSGLNIATGGNSILGFTSGKCLNSKEELITVLTLLCNPKYSVSEISKITGATTNVINSIKYERRHIWLNEEYPELVEKVRDNIAKGLYQQYAQEKRYGTYAILTSPEGTTYTVTNSQVFAKQFNLNGGHLRAVIRGEEGQHKGWTLRKE